MQFVKKPLSCLKFEVFKFNYMKTKWAFYLVMKSLPKDIRTLQWGVECQIQRYGLTLFYMRGGGVKSTPPGWLLYANPRGMPRMGWFYFLRLGSFDIIKIRSNWIVFSLNKQCPFFHAPGFQINVSELFLDLKKVWFSNT